MNEGLYQFKQRLNNEGVIFCYSGPITQELTEVIGHVIRTKPEINQDRPNLSLKVFSVFVEMVQNVLNYSETLTEEHHHEEREGVVVVGRDEKGYYVLCGNQIDPASVERITKRLETLQQMDKDALRKHYKEQRRKDPDEFSKGAGLGFIEIARKAESFEFSFAPISPKTTFFSLKALF
ncbi:MAG: hypothetical protein HQL48_08925 [Gammaproteobacteria bacterium]|nr:hypothetical protein [Gammaproteobacteria bacterium]